MIAYINNQVDLPISLISYPRSGSHYFAKTFYEKTGFNIIPSHQTINIFDENKNKRKRVVAIIRDPNDSIQSVIAMQQQYGMNISNQMIEENLSQYSLLYDFINRYADFIIDFNDLIKTPDLVIDSLISELSLKESGPYIYGPKLDEQNPNYIPSSKVLPNYNKIDLTKYNIGLCNYEYKQSLNKKFKV